MFSRDHPWRFRLRACGIFLKAPATIPNLRNTGWASRVCRAAASVQDGTLRSKSYVLYVEVFPSEAMAVGFTPLGYSLIGATTTMEKLPERYSVDSRHPIYRIGWPSGCEVCIMIYADFTSAASPADVERVSKFDFSCLTRWVHPCRFKRDVMPTAWQDIRTEHPEMSPD